MRYEISLFYFVFPAGTVWELHTSPVRGVTSGQSVCLRCHDDDGPQGADAAELPAGAPADAAGGAAGASAEQRPHSVQVGHEIAPLLCPKHVPLRFHNVAAYAAAHSLAEDCRGAG